MKLFLRFALLVSISTMVDAGDPVRGTPVKIEGCVFEPQDVSGVVAVGHFLVLGADELGSIQVLDEQQTGYEYATREATNLVDAEIQRLANTREAELDLEGAAADGNTVYVIGSHSRKRFKVEPAEAADRTVAENRERLGRTSVERSREFVFRLELQADGSIKTDTIQRISLRDFLNQDSIIGPFAGLPSKENGIDIEGLAFKNQYLYAGCRGPVLRQNWVPVVRFEFDKPASAEVRYVPLDGLGIRGMQSVQEGFLLLAGPVGDQSGPYRIYLWNGEDCIPGKSRLAGEVKLLATVLPIVPAGKAEGITLIGNERGNWIVLIAFDSAKKNDEILGRFVVPSDASSNQNPRHRRQRILVSQ